MKLAFSLLVVGLLVLNSLAIRLQKDADASQPTKVGNSPLVDGFRPPSVPLIVFDPYMSIWSNADKLTDDWPRLWDGTVKALSGMLRVDGTTYRFMGPSGLGTNNVMNQDSVKVYPTQTVYQFSLPQVALTLTFTTPTIPQNLELLSQPITYISYSVESRDGKSHEVQLYYDQTGEICVNQASEEIVWSRPPSTSGAPQYIMMMGTKQQNVLGLSGDGVGINWGHAYIGVSSVSSHDVVKTVIAGSVTVRNSFIESGTIPTTDDTRMPRAASDDWPVMAVAWSFTVAPGKPANRHLIFAYDDIFSINYFGQLLVPYWRRNHQTPMNMLINATRDYSNIMSLCKNFDTELLNKLNNVGGDKYATITSLAFRQTFGGCKLTWNSKRNIPWYFMKEISSDGDLSTVDVIFPASPLILYSNPYLLELLLLPLMAYANNETNVPYNLAWAPHHLGYYPIGNIKPDQQEQMPVEETGNMLIMIAAIAHHDLKSVSLLYPTYSDLIESWAAYLNSGAGVLPDPGDQLCTDDFEGPSPHNVNLAIKGIEAVGSYAYLCKLLGRAADARKYQAIAQNFTSYWLKNAYDGDHYRLQYNLPNTWSLKYNIMYQKVLGISVVSQSVIDTEVNYYLKHQLNHYGVPLNNLKAFTKLDWLSWIAAMASDNAAFHTLIDCIYAFANDTPDRVPLSDWYETDSAKQTGFRARTVVGGTYAKMLMK